MIKIVLISSIFYLTILISDEVWSGNTSSIDASYWDKNKSKKVENNSSLDGNRTSFVWK
jgi:hypothetical protein